MNKPNDGGPAFPSHGTMGEVIQDGMSLHAYFSAHAPALPRFVLDSFVAAKKGGAVMDLNEHAKMCARWARLYADAMLRELSPPTTTKGT
jgi:hypothetical protein